jgi:hypothetical protein
MSLAIELAKSGEALKSGPWGLAIVLILCVACYFLFKSMSKHLKKVRDEFPVDEPRPATSAARPAAGPPQIATSIQIASSIQVASPAQVAAAARVVAAAQVVKPAQVVEARQIEAPEQPQPPVG